MQPTRICVFDVETTGLVVHGLRSDHPDQPHAVEFAALMCDDDGQILERFHALVKPEGWVIPSAATRIHGITTEQALADGIPEPLALVGFMQFIRPADERVAHNEAFDARIVRIGMNRFMTEEAAEEWRTTPKPNCTLEMARAHGGFRSHKLGAIYRALFHADPANPHKGMADAEACRRIFFELRARQGGPRVALLDNVAERLEPFA